MDGMAESSLAEMHQDPLAGLINSDGVDRRSIELLVEWIGRERERGVEPLRPRLAQREIDRCTTR